MGVGTRSAFVSPTVSVRQVDFFVLGEAGGVPCFLYINAVPNTWETLLYIYILFLWARQSFARNGHLLCDYVQRTIPQYSVCVSRILRHTVVKAVFVELRASSSRAFFVCARCDSNSASYDQTSPQHAYAQIQKREPGTPGLKYDAVNSKNLKTPFLPICRRGKRL